MNHISVIDRYHEYKSAIHELTASIVTGIFDDHIFENEENLATTMKWLQKTYPFVDLIFTLDGTGLQLSSNISRKNFMNGRRALLHGADRRHRPYFKKAIESETVIVTDPYLSNASHNLCISAAIRFLDDSDNVKGVLVVDIDLKDAIEFLMGDGKRKRFNPLFKVVYSILAIGLFIVVGILIYSAASEINAMFVYPPDENVHLKPFGAIIFLTLALAIFDLSKTILEEEVLMNKDIFRHSSTRRTITRFIAAILIAVSIESLLLMFKSVLGSPQFLNNAVAMMVAAVGLLIGLGVYVYLGAKAEAILKNTNLNRR